VWPEARLVNHFQLNLAAYARWEQATSPSIQTLALQQPTLAALGAVNIFPSFAELALASQDWPLRRSYNCVLPNPFIPALPKAIDNVEKSAFTFLAAGRFSDFVKGADILYRACRRVWADIPAVRLEVASDSERFSEILRPLPPTSWRRYPWMRRDELHALMRAADVVIVPSRYEPFGMVALEAMAMGTPVIAMSVGGLREMVHHNVTGWLCPPHEGSSGLAEAMQTAIGAGRPALRAMGDAATHLVQRDYSLEQICDRIRAIFDNLARETAAGRIRPARFAVAANRQRVSP
jgi:glycosyltransferase involved in cell wall biosynthesis